MIDQGILESRLDRLEKLIYGYAKTTNNNNNNYDNGNSNTDDQDATVIARINRIKGITQAQNIQTIRQKLSGLLSETPAATIISETIDLESILEEVLIFGPVHTSKAVSLLKELQELVDTTVFEIHFEELEKRYPDLALCHHNQREKLSNIQQRLEFILEKYPIMMEEISQYFLYQSAIHQ